MPAYRNMAAKVTLPQQRGTTKKNNENRGAASSLLECFPVLPVRGKSAHRRVHLHMIDGLLNLSFWGYVGVTLALTHVTIASVTIFLHRHQAHRALTLHPIASHFFRFWLWLTTGMVTANGWQSSKHHAKCEHERTRTARRFGDRRVLLGA